jgi:glycosyltransferase involved in cell wall biosynthesis
MVVVIYDMPRAAPRTLLSLSAACQRGIASDDYEIIVVDNGSSRRPDPALLGRLAGNSSYLYLDDASPSPAAAANIGLRQARGEVVGVMVDGARLVTPGLLAWAARAATLHPRAVVGTVNFHLGRERQGIAVARGYDEAAEDALLDSVRWPEDGYRLYEISVLAGSTPGGWFAPLLETNALFLRAELWTELGGIDERFQMPGGGYANLDLWRRAVSLPDSELVLLLGEATFHQLHGGITTNAAEAVLLERMRRWRAEYHALRGGEYRSPDRAPLILGEAPPSLMPHLREASEFAAAYPGACVHELYWAEHADAT